MNNDITSLQPENNTLNLLWEHSNDGLLWLDDQNIIVQANPKACLLLQHPLIGSPLNYFFSQTVEDNWQLLHSLQGQIINIRRCSAQLVMLRPIATSESIEAVVAQVINSTPNCVCLSDAQGRILVANQATLRFLELSDNIIGFNTLVGNHPNLLNISLEELDKVIIHGQTLKKEEILFNLPKYDDHFATTITPIVLPSGEVGAMNISINIQSKKDQEEIIKQRDIFLLGLNKVNNLILSSKPQEDILLEIIDIIQEITQSVTTSLYKFDHLQAYAWPYFKSGSQQSVLDLSWEHYQQLYEKDYLYFDDNNPDLEFHDAIQQKNSKSVLLFPIMVESQLWGILEILDHRPANYWGDSELILLKSTATSISNVLTQKNTQSVLFSTQQQLYSAIESMSDAFALYDNQNKLVIANLDIWKDYSYPLCPHMEIGKSYQDIIEDAYDNGVYGHISGISENNNIPLDLILNKEAFLSHELELFLDLYQGLHEIQTKNGNWLLISARRTKDNGTVVIATNISSMKKREQALEASEQRNLALLQAIPDTIFRISDTGIYLDDSTSSQSNSDSFFVGKSIFDVLPEEIAHQALRCIEDAIKFKNLSILEYTITNKNNQHIDYEARIVKNGSNEVVAIVRDVSEHKKIEKLKNEFVSTVSHELRTPLTSIRGSLGLISGGILGDLPLQIKSMVNIAYNNAERLIRLINDILDIEKIESGKIVFNMQDIEISQLIKRAIDENIGYAENFHVSINYLFNHPEIIFRGDPDRLLQVLTNLLSNAIKFSPAFGEVNIKTFIKKNYIVCELHDDGQGIPDNFKHQIFEKFAQADTSSQRSKGGTGLGLSISKAIIEKHGGKIDFKSKDMGGTIFYFSLPYNRIPEIEEVSEAILVYTHDNKMFKLLDDIISKKYHLTLTTEKSNILQKLNSGNYKILLTESIDHATFTDIQQYCFNHHIPILLAPESINKKILVLYGSNKSESYDSLKFALRATQKNQPKQPLVLHIEDDSDIYEVVRTILKDTADLTHASDLNQAQLKLKNTRFDLVIVDLTLPDGNSQALIQQLQKNTPSTPVIIFSASDTPISPKADAHLVKSRSTNQDLLHVVECILQGVPHES